MMTDWDGLGGRLILPAADYRRNRAAWLKARRSGLGASDTAAILGLNPWTTPVQVWEAKTATGEPEDAGSDAANWGNILEHPVAVQTAKHWPHIGRIAPTPGLLAHEEHPWMLATVDRLLVDRGRGSRKVRSVLEVKTTTSQNWRQNWVEGVPPAAVQVQVQQQLAVTGLEVAWVACWLRDTAKLCEPVPVYRSEAVIEQLVHYAGMWWADHVVAGVRPEPVFGDLGRLGQLYPADLSADAVVAGPDLEAAVAELIDAKRRKSEAEADEKRARFVLETAMKERTAVVDAGGEALVTWKPQTVRRVDTAALKAAEPDLAARFTREKTDRVLRVATNRKAG